MEYKERKRLKFLGLPFTFTVYHVKEEVITTDKGFLTKEENDCYMYKVQDVKLTRTFAERLVGIGTVVCYTGDTTDKVLTLEHIKHSREVKDFILAQSEEERRKRRTMNTLDISADIIDDISAAEPDDVDSDN